MIIGVITQAGLVNLENTVSSKDAHHFQVCILNLSFLKINQKSGFRSLEAGGVFYFFRAFWEHVCFYKKSFQIKNSDKKT